MGKAQSRDRGPGPCVHTPLRSEEECPGANSTADPLPGIAMASSHLLSTSRVPGLC